MILCDFNRYRTPNPSTVLKRKRSDSEISTTSSILAPSSSSQYMYSDSSIQSIQSPSMFCSRTRKRYRDNRPEEQAVHQHTLNILFAAQSKRSKDLLPRSKPSIFLPRDPIAPLPCSQPHHQSSLHSFWHLPKARSQSPSSSSSASSANTPTVAPQIPSGFNSHDGLEVTSCEDCDVTLAFGNDGDVEMLDIDVAGDGDSHACTECGKVVCHACAVTNLGVERKCLLCAGKGSFAKTWTGGIGWC